MEIDSAVVPVVQVSNLDFRFDSALPLVLKDVTMSIARGRYEHHDIPVKSLLPSVYVHALRVRGRGVKLPKKIEGARDRAKSASRCCQHAPGQSPLETIQRNDA